MSDGGIRVLLVDPFVEPREASVDPSGGGVARAIGCDRVDYVSLSDDGERSIDAWFDDDGIARGAEPNRLVWATGDGAMTLDGDAGAEPVALLCGRILVAAADTRTGETVGLSDEEAARVRAALRPEQTLRAWRYVADVVGRARAGREEEEEER